MTNEEFEGDDPGEFTGLDPDHFPTYEELVFGGEWREEEPFVEPEPPRRSPLGYIGLTLIFLVVVGLLLSLISHQQYDVGYVNGERDSVTQAYQAGMDMGYSSGQQQGQLEAMVGLQEWQVAHGCVVDKNGYTLLRIWRDNENRYQFECATQAKK